MQKSINQPYKNGFCRTCIHCQNGNACSVNARNAASIPCLAVHACNKYVQQRGQTKMDSIFGKLKSTKLLKDDSKKSIAASVTNFVHKREEKRLARQKKAAN